MKPSIRWGVCLCVFILGLLAWPGLLYPQNTDDHHPNPLSRDELVDEQKSPDLDSADSGDALEAEPAANESESTDILDDVEDQFLFERTETTADQSPGEAPSFGWTALKIFGTLAILLAILIGSMWGMKRFMPGVPKLGGSDLIQILARTRVTQSQSVMLLRIGRRGLIIGVGPETIRTLAEVDNTEELDVLTAQSAEQASQTIAGSFKDLFQRHGREMESEFETQLQEEQQVDKMENELTEIRKRISSWSDEDETL